MKKIFALIIVLCFCVLNVNAGTLKGDAKTKRISAGTPFDIEFAQDVSTSSGLEGDFFTAILKSDLSAGTTIVIPKGSFIRGSISSVNTAKRFSRGAKLYLDFDHVVTPTGRQIPLALSVVHYDKIYYDGALYKNLGYGEAIQNNFERAKEITVNSTNYGLSVKDTHPGLQYLTTPFCAVGGFLGGVGYWIGDGVADMFRKGQDVYLRKGEVLSVRLINPIDVPVY